MDKQKLKKELRKKYKMTWVCGSCFLDILEWIDEIYETKNQNDNK